jgi:hypothetical protein
MTRTSHGDPIISFLFYRKIYRERGKIVHGHDSRAHDASAGSKSTKPGRRPRIRTVCWEPVASCYVSLPRWAETGARALVVGSVEETRPEACAELFVGPKRRPCVENRSPHKRDASGNLASRDDPLTSPDGRRLVVGCAGAMPVPSTPTRPRGLAAVADWPVAAGGYPGAPCVPPMPLAPTLPTPPLPVLFGH